MDLRHAAVRLQQAAQEKFGVKAKIKTGRSGDMTVSVNGHSVFAYKEEGSMPKIEELLRRIEGVKSV
jgi:predicted Rdx family selenoprotein